MKGLKKTEKDFERRQTPLFMEVDRGIVRTYKAGKTMLKKFYLLLRIAVYIIPFFIFPAQSISQVPTFKEVSGHEIGDRITENYQIVQYLRSLENTSDRVTIHEIGTTYNHRQQLAAILTHPDNHARLSEIRTNGKLLSDPRKLTQQQAAEIIEHQPVILYLGGSIHGFELSGTESLLRILEFFTTSGSEEVLEQLRNTVLIIDPVINPDGRDAFAQYSHQHTGRVQQYDRADWNSDVSSWDGTRFRTSHYYFDLNRDWLTHTHPEIRNRTELFREWPPQAGVDAHEMDAEREFFIDPPAGPYSPWFPPFAGKWFEEYGQMHAENFDRENIEYTKREIFNYFYPAYLSSYLSYQGGVGMLYEQGTSSGFAAELSDGTVRKLQDAVFNQYTAFRSMIRTSGERRQELLFDYFQAGMESIESGSEGISRYLITKNGDPGLVAEAVNLMMRSGIEVDQLQEPASFSDVRNRYGESAENRSFDADTYVIEASQPKMRYIRQLMEPHIQIPGDFLEEARFRIERAENPEFYDVTSWSLPLLFNLEAFSASDSRSLETARLEEPVTAGGGAPAGIAGYAYLIDGSQTSLLSTIHPLREAGIRLHIIYKPTSIYGKTYSSGTLVIRTDGNEEKVHGIVSKLAEKHDLNVDPVDSGIPDPGYPTLGTIEGNRVQKPVIALLGGEPVNGYSFGWAWHTLDRTYEIPHTVIRAARIPATPLERFNVLIMPEIQNMQELSDLLGDEGIARIKRWIQDGGNLVTIGNATEYVRREINITGLGSWYEADQHRHKQRISVPGAFFHSELDLESWLVSGYSADLPLFIHSDRLYRRPDGPPRPEYRSPVIVRHQNPSLISGHAWDENRERLPGSVFLYEQKIGRGRVISFAEDVNFRGHWRGANRLFLNSVILSPGAP